MVPLTPATPAGVAIEIEPLDVAELYPALTLNDPPIADAPTPAAKLSAPPSAVPAPTEKLAAPALPWVFAPVAIEMPAAHPAPELPVRRDKAPLTP